MYATSHHTDHSPANAFFKLSLAIVAFAFAIIGPIKKRKTRLGIVNTINNQMKKFLIFSQDFVVKVQGDISQERAIEIHSLCNKALLTCSSLHKKLKKANFLNNSETKRIAEQTLSNFFDAEFKLRLIAYRDADVDGADDELNEFSSTLSQNSLNYNNAI